MSGKEKLSLQEASELLQNLQSEISDLPIDGFSDEEVSANNLLEFLLDSSDDDQETKQDSKCSIHVLDESRSFFRVHTGYFSNIPKCIKAEFIASWACSQSSVVSSSQR
ncbi:hypothetical protein TNCV_2179731 [Trichonephila clavipes]|uniref:Uncharacterized protein n=1 Tax=Trichonephila clavipes TaxID=2585209 RepID=A0A8X7B9C5_TRICX|nr:hypothetical protein TNCV_2179731 [Trichonephila clavipes]